MAIDIWMWKSLGVVIYAMTVVRPLTIWVHTAGPKLGPTCTQNIHGIWLKHTKVHACHRFSQTV